MHTITSYNVNHALREGVSYLRRYGVSRDSRNGPVLVAPTPVTTVYNRPAERVLFNPERDANPFFHLIESLWMLAGRNDIATLTPYVSRMKDFSDDGGVTQPGAYGKRWRSFFFRGFAKSHGQDQLSWAIKRLVANPDDRRVIIQMYHCDVDQVATDEGGKDIPCNIVCAPWIDTENCLSMTIFCRSNDIIWGAYGANAVHFSFLQEYLAAGVGVPLGKMYQVSNNYHMYKATEPKGQVHVYDWYAAGTASVKPLFEDGCSHQHFDEDLTIFFDEPSAVGLRSAFLRQVACPMVMAHKAWRNKKDPDRFTKASEIIAQCRADDWRIAGTEWINRRWAALMVNKEETA